MVLPSGLQYRILAEGQGASPAPEDLVVVHYQGRLVDETEFDSSFARGAPAVFPANRLIAGWVEALQLMQVGDRWELVVPAELAYGENGSGEVIPPNATLIFEVELLEVQTVEEQNQAQENAAAGFIDEQQAYLARHAEREGSIVLPSGLQYRVLESGSGASPRADSLVKVHYRGQLTDGTEFDSSYVRGEPSEFPANRLIAGWVEALQLMREGDKWELVIPAELAYGARGAGDAIPPHATLIFEMELIEVLE